MITIDGVNYNILLFLNDTTNPSKEYEFEFPSFSEMNQFFKQNRDNPEYVNCKAEYTFVEVNEYGESNSYSWTQDIAFKELSVEEIIGLIEEYRQWWTETQEVFAEGEGRMKEFIFVLLQIDGKARGICLRNMRMFVRPVFMKLRIAVAHTILTI